MRLEHLLSRETRSIQKFSIRLLLFLYFLIFKKITLPQKVEGGCDKTDWMREIRNDSPVAQLVRALH